MLLEQLARGEDRPEAHAPRVAAGVVEGPQVAERRSAFGARRLAGHEQDRGRAIGDRARIADRHRAPAFGK